MFKIGDFSRLARVSVKLLHHYDAVGLLLPRRIDRETGYRYYSADQFPRLAQILAYRDLGFSLREIAELLDAPAVAGERRAALVAGRIEAAARELALQQQRLRRLALLARGAAEARLPAAEVTLQALPAGLMATARARVPSTGAPITRLFEATEAYVFRQRARAADSPQLIFHDEEYRDDNLDVEVAIPLRHPIPPGTEDGVAVTVSTLPACAAMACVTYRGDYAQTAEVLAGLISWIAANGYQVAGPLREVYRCFGVERPDRFGLSEGFLAAGPADYVTELQVPVAPAADPT